MSDKPHHGRIENWYKAHGKIFGRALDHFRFAGQDIHTSRLIRHDEETGEIETENSRYTLVEKGVEL